VLLVSFEHEMIIEVTAHFKLQHVAYLKGIVHPKIKLLSSLTTRQLMVTIDFHSRKKDNMEVILQNIFFVFSREKEFHTGLE